MGTFGSEVYGDVEVYAKSKSEAWPEYAGKLILVACP